MKKIWFVSHYSMPPKYEMRIKTQMYAHYLKQMGYETKIFSASTIHNTDINLINDNKEYICCKYDDLDFVHIKCNNYTGNGIKRIKNMLEFSIKFKTVARNFSLPDVIVADVNCINYEPIYNFCKQNKIKFFIDMRDLWPMSIVEYYGYSERNPIIKYLYNREKNMYKRADGIIFSMEGGREYIKDKGWGKYIEERKIHYINNGVNLGEFYREVQNFRISDQELDDMDTFKVIYTGSVRVANDLKTVVDAAKIIKNNGYNNIKILIYGDGPDKNTLSDYCKENNIDNIHFKGFVEKKYVPYLLSKSDISLLNYKNAKTLRYGGSQNKLFEYMAAGKPVLVTVDMNYSPVVKYNCGISLKQASPESIANAIIHLYQLPHEERYKMGENAKDCVKEYDFKKLTERLEGVIFSK